MMSTLKEKLGDTAIEIDLAHGRTNISRRQVRQSIDRFTVAECEKLDSTTYNEFETFYSLLEKSLAAIVRGGVDDVRAFFRDKMQQERTISNAAYSMVTEQTAAHLAEDQGTMDTVLMQLQTQFNTLLNEHSKLKSVMETMIKQEEVCCNKKHEVSY